MTEAERELHRQRMIGNTHGVGQKMSEANKLMHSERMVRSNPMKIAEVRDRMLQTVEERYGKDFFANTVRRLRETGRIGVRKSAITDAEKAAISDRMKSNNPMYRDDVVEKVMMSFTPERRKAISDRLKQTWAEGKIVPLMFTGQGPVKAANKMELMLLPLVEKYHGRFVGDGTMWLPITTSGIRRNPDFIFGSGKAKTALLLHGTYWHRDQNAVEVEMLDYLDAGWNLFVLWTKRISKWMLPSIENEVLAWLAESSESTTPVLRQFMTWNATRTTTS